jgi:chromosomal replication initiator protein DnaA
MESFIEAWNNINEYCQSQITETAFNLWIKEIIPISLENGVAQLQVRTNFHKDLILQNYSNLLNSAFDNVFGFRPKIEITASDPDPVLPEYLGGPRDNNNNNNIINLTPPGASNEYTFDNYIVGSSNKFAHAACQAVAATSASRYNPLFIYGGSGLGKTHLLFAIYNQINLTRQNQNIIYIKGDDFTNELVEAIGKNSTANFRLKYRQADILLVDDIQFIAGKIQTQEEFFHTFDTLYQAGKQIILTSDRPPKEISSLEDRLRTRFEWGLLADIQPPDLETRIAIIKRKCKQLDVDLSDDICMYIANRLKTNIRQLEGVVKKIKAYNLLESVSPTIIAAQNAIRDVLNDNQPTPVTIERILKEVARTYGVTPEDIKSNKRSSQISLARQLSIYVVREITQLSLSVIGEEFGGRDHSTIVYALNQVEKRMKADIKFKSTVLDTVKNLREI